MATKKSLIESQEIAESAETNALVETPVSIESDTSPAEVIPNPPGGGSWKWNAETRQWIPKEAITEPPHQPIETQE
jgi:hypothetical protein